MRPRGMGPAMEARYWAAAAVSVAVTGCDTLDYQLQSIPPAYRESVIKLKGRR